MRRCSECGQIVESERDKANKHVFSWTFMSVIMSGLTWSFAEWNIRWWLNRMHLTGILLALAIGTVFCWVRFVQVQRSTKSGGAS